jgi:flagellar motor protein MotB
LPPFPDPAAQPDRNISSVTVSTQDFLDATHSTTSKNDMSIKSIINHTTVTGKGKKRKADDISEDEPEPEAAPAAEPADVVAGADAPAQVTVEEMTEDVLILPTKSAVFAPVEKRPVKRLRTVASHVGAFALGSVAVVAGLMSLPDNYFG